MGASLACVQAELGITRQTCGVNNGRGNRVGVNGSVWPGGRDMIQRVSCLEVRGASRSGAGEDVWDRDKMEASYGVGESNWFRGGHISVLLRSWETL